MATRYFKATFADGSIHTRSSMSRAYVKASLCKAIGYDKRIWVSVSFHMTEGAALPPTAVEVALVVEIDAKEYRAHKPPAKRVSAAALANNCKSAIFGSARK